MLPAIAMGLVSGWLPKNSISGLRFSFNVFRFGQDWPIALRVSPENGQYETSSSSSNGSFLTASATPLSVIGKHRTRLRLRRLLELQIIVSRS